MKIYHLFEEIAQPMTPQGVIDRMVLRAFKRPDGFLSPNLCHSVSLQYIIDHGMPTDELIMVGTQGKVHHSFVVDRSGKILADSFAFRKPDWDGRNYTFGHNTYVLVHKMTIKEFSKNFIRGTSAA